MRHKRAEFLLLALLVLGVVGVLLTTRRHSQAPLSADAHADYILIRKSAHTMTLFDHGEPIKTYRVALGRGGLGQKVRAGDNKVPEGVYRIAGRNLHSAFHRALRVSYPSPAQAAEEATRKIDPGGDIMIHGIRNGLGWIGSLQSRFDWTKGCIAVDDDEIEEVWHVVPDGTPVEIRP